MYSNVQLTVKYYLHVCDLLFYHTSWMAVVTQTDRPESVHNRCGIEDFGGVFYVTLLFGVFCGYKGFCHTIECDILLFLSIYNSQYSVWNCII